MSHGPTTIPVPRSLATVDETHGEPIPVTEDLAYLCTTMVNLYFVGPPGAGDRGWVLVDTGLPGSASRIATAAANRFCPDSRPSAIILTHGHFDHVGGLPELAEWWDVPVYAHELELPYLIGMSKYPPPDPTVGGGMVARSAYLYPRGPIDLGPRVRRLPADGSVPHMPGWRWIFTPGHSPGHISLFRDEDRLLIAGDAFVTTKNESLVCALTQHPRFVHAPPAYYTPDWESARDSVRRLEALHPHVAATGHGAPMRNPRLAHELHILARDFDHVAVPRHGRYVNQPAVADETGVKWYPPPAPDPFPTILAGVAVAGALAATIAIVRARHDDED